MEAGLSESEGGLVMREYAGQTHQHNDSSGADEGIKETTLQG